MSRDRKQKGGRRTADDGPAVARAPRPSLLAIVAGVVMAAATVLWWIEHRRHPSVEARDGEPAVASRAAGTAEPPIAYVPNAACVECHEAEAAKWRMSHHFRAMEPASPESVRGDFGGVEFERDGVTSRFLRRDGRYVVRTDGPDGRLADFDVAYTFGVDPLQQYLLPLPGGRMGAFTIAWDVGSKRWFDLFPEEKTPPGDVLHWTGRYQSWNTMCASCHSTNLQKRYDAVTDTFHTTWSEVDVSCQACHGPGERHVARARAGARGDDGLVPLASSSEREIETCAPCHARRSEIAAAPVPGAPLYDGYLPALLTEDLYYPDGQQLGEVYVYGSFRQTRMYQAGVRCTDCHDAHTAALRADGNDLCVRCHQSAPDTTRFPGLAAKSYDSPAHHFHAAGSPGAQCVGCHMPARNYMIIDARRDHAIRIPRPDLTVTLGTPNACTGCHGDHDAKWAADAVERWYGPTRHEIPHYGEVIALGRAGRPGAEGALAKLVMEPEWPAIVSATAVDLLGRYGPASVPASVSATHDTDPAVRTAAVASLERVPAADRVPLVAPLLGDSRRAVRMEAARVLSSATSRIDPAERRAYDAAMAEFRAAQETSLDMPGAHLNLAVVAGNEGDAARAEAEYRAALRLDPDFTPARLNLSQLLNARGRNTDAERVLRDGLARVPSQGDLQYSLGLLLAEDERLPEAADALGRAADLLPTRARARYNYALALQQLGRRDEAAGAYARAQALDPDDPGIAYAVAVFYAQQQDWPRALAAAERLAVLTPDDAQVQAFVAELRRRAAGALGPE